MSLALFVVAVLLAGALLFAFAKLNEARRLLGAVKGEGLEASGRLDELRRELGAAKEDLAKKQRALDDAREEAKRKARREGKKMQREDETMSESTAGESHEEVALLKKAIAGLEQQVHDLTQRLEAARAESRREAEGELAAAREEAAAVHKTLDELRDSVRRKAEERPDVPGTTLDLKALPAEAVQELARYFRKAEEFERLYGVSQGRLQLAQERAQDLQRRYYAVCRELALITGTPAPSSDEEAKRAAEAVVEKSDAAAHAAGATGGAPAQEAAAAALGEEGAKKKKRRRRRRKKRPGAEGAEGAAAGAEGAAPAEEEGAEDEGEEEESEGEGEGEGEGGEVAAAPAPEQAVTTPVAEEPRATPTQEA